MIKKQSGGTSVVHSAIHLIHPKGEASDIDSTAVTFATLTDRDVDWWMATNLWRDRSGSFQIDGPGQLMIERIEGDWTGVVGLPIFKLGKLLCEAGFLDA
jgi:septum formation protein